MNREQERAQEAPMALRVFWRSAMKGILARMAVVGVFLAAHQAFGDVVPAKPGPRQIAELLGLKEDCVTISHA